MIMILYELVFCINAGLGIIAFFIACLSLMWQWLFLFLLFTVITFLIGRDITRLETIQDLKKEVYNLKFGKDDSNNVNNKEREKER